MTSSPSAGTLVVRWYVTVAHKQTLIASGSVRSQRAGRKTLRIRLTRTGRARLKSAKTAKVVIEVAFTPSGHKAMSEHKTVTLKS